jgi:fumarate reductase subunit D
VNGDVPIGQLFSQLVDDGKRYARAEVELYKAKAADKAEPVKWAAIFGGAALTLVLSAVTALLVGLILALETLVGPLAATLIVVLATLAIAGLLGWVAYKRIAEARK